ncbi:uncharacterized protein LOC126807987 isoform X2 [Patella vulgata]|uniref:uncharacterized protein LOC126807987 isoform X2 n=1 Tax=Patella vulgata TaxID=6465 RepID=UPI0021806211|nr:uncharacterized protein LOC126807987 isoform X2 [Patella vulgata]
MDIKSKILMWLLLVYAFLLLIQVDVTEAKRKRHKRLPKNDAYECEWQVCQKKKTKKCHKIQSCVKERLQSYDEKVHQLKKKQLQAICIRIIHDKHKRYRFNKKCWQPRNGQTIGRKENIIKIGDNVNYALSTRPSAFTPSTYEVPNPYLGGENGEHKGQQASGRREKTADLPLVNDKVVVKSGEAIESTISTGSSVVTQSTSDISIPDIVYREETNLEEREESDSINSGSSKTEEYELSNQYVNKCDGISIQIEDMLPTQVTTEDYCNSIQYHEDKDVSVHCRPFLEHNNRTENEFRLGHSYQNNLLVDEVNNSNNDHTQTELILKNQLCNTVESSPTWDCNRPVSSSSSLESYICLPIELPPIDFFKSIRTKDVNITELLQRDEGTQTKHTNQATTIFNTQFQGSASFNQQGGELQLPGSSVRLVVPPETVKESESIHILGHVHSDLRQLKNTLQLEESENIYSPAPEYHMDANWKMVIKKHMVINIPHALQPGFQKSQLKVYQFSATGGTVIKSVVPEKSKENGELSESYYEIETDVVRIFTLHFSGFVLCYYCEKEISCPRLLNVDILGSYQIINRRREVRIQYLVWDMKGNIPDFRNSWIANNKSKFHQLERKSVTLEPYEDIDMVILTFNLTTTGEEANQWQTLTTENGDMEPFPLKTIVPLKKLMVCCREGPHNIEWVMISKPDHLPREQFQCIITMSDNIGDLHGASANRYPASYIQNVPQHLPERSMGIMDVLKRDLDEAQVEELCSKCHFPPETLAQLKNDKREMPAITFKEKWVDQLYKKNDFKLDLESHLTSVKAWQVLSALSEMDFLKKEAVPLYKFDSSGPEAMAKPSGFYLRRSSPVEHSDHEDYELGFYADVDETEVKVLETQV